MTTLCSIRYLLVLQLVTAILPTYSYAQQIPQNAIKNQFGPGWVCERGFQKVGGRCIAVKIPRNAELNVYGNGWVCKRGFQNVAGTCAAVQIPANAELNVFGNGWTCKHGFKSVGNECRKMSPSELAAYEKTLKEILARRNRLVGSGNSYTSERGAEFSVRVRDADLNCREGFSSGYDSCEIEVSYAVTTNYNGNDDPNVRVRCEAEVSYTDKSGWSGTKSEDESKSFYVYGQSHNGSMEIDVRFYEAAVRVRLTEVQCKIVSVY